MNTKINNYKKYEVFKEFGSKLHIEDATILKNELLRNIQYNGLVEIDFKGVTYIPKNFFNVLLIPILATIDRTEVYAKLSFSNIKNIEDFKRVYYGTTNIKYS